METLERKSTGSIPGLKEQANGALAVRDARTSLTSKADEAKKRRQKQAQRQYGRGAGVDVRSIKNKKLRRTLGQLEQKYKDAALEAKDAEILHENEAGFLEPEGELERTYKTRQDEITEGVAVETAQKRFDLSLDGLGPYLCDYTRNGRELLIGGRKGHVATFDWREGKLGCEIQLGETVRDVKWLHNNQYFAVAQKKTVYIYDRNGVELHNLRKHINVTHMEFLPYHFLLCTAVSHLPCLSCLFKDWEVDLLLISSCYLGTERYWHAQISRHINRPNRVGGSIKTRPNTITRTKSLERHSAHGPQQRHRDALVTKLIRSPR